MQRTKSQIPVCRDISIVDLPKIIKKSGAQPSVCPKAALPLGFESVNYSIFPTVQTAEILMKEILLPIP